MAENSKNKMTEIGNLPSDWDVMSLSEIGRFSKGSGVTRDQSHSGDIPCVRYGELYTTHDNYIRSFSSFISAEVAKTATKLSKGDILFAGSGETKEEIGKAVAFVGDEEAYAGGDIIILSPKIEASSMYLGFVLNDEESVRQKSSMGQGDAVVHIHAKELANVIIPFPHPSEQRKIAASLSGIDTLISDMDKVIAKKRLMMTGTMQLLLSGKKRLKGFSRPWVDLELGELGKLTGAGVDKTVNADEKPVRLLNFLDVYNRDRIYNHELKMWVTASDYKIAKCDVRQGDIFLTPSSELPNDIGRSAVAMSDMDGVCYSYHVLRLRPSIDLDMTFSAYMLKTAEYEEQIRFLSEGSGKRYVISLRNFREIRISIPDDIREQNAIGNVIAAMDNEIAALEAERDKYKNIKQGMMQKLLTGQIRLPV